jgi:hypothetical protein
VRRPPLSISWHPEVYMGATKKSRRTKIIIVEGQMHVYFSRLASSG